MKATKTTSTTTTASPELLKYLDKVAAERSQGAQRESHVGTLCYQVSCDACSLDELLSDLLKNGSGYDVPILTAAHALVQRIGAVSDLAADALGSGILRDPGNWNFSGDLLGAKLWLDGHKKDAQAQPIQTPTNGPAGTKPPQLALDLASAVFCALLRRIKALPDVLRTGFENDKDNDHATRFDHEAAGKVVEEALAEYGGPSLSLALGTFLIHILNGCEPPSPLDEKWLSSAMSEA